MKVYTKAGKEYKGSHHKKMPNGQIPYRKKNILKIVSVYIKQKRKDNGNIPR